MENPLVELEVSCLPMTSAPFPAAVVYLNQTLAVAVVKEIDGLLGTLPYPLIPSNNTDPFPDEENE